MNFLRRRNVGDAANQKADATVSEPEAPETDGEFHILGDKKLENLVKSPKGGKRRTAWIFALGGIFGLAVAAFFVGSNDYLDLTKFQDLNMDSIFDVLPAGMLREAKDFQKQEKAAIAYDSFAIGLQAKSEGVEAVHPVIMIPGVISTGLESWSTEENERQYFRKRLWGSWSMMRSLVLDKAGWKRNIMLDKKSGLDPPGVKLRAAQGFDATDFFITGYWIWNKILENLATIGYDPTNAFTAAYDWRLSYMNMEVRDQYFTRLKSHIEVASKVSGKKVTLLSHSMGSQVLYYFLHWVEAEGYGNGGPAWVEEHVDSWINISGCMLGALKGFPAVLSGEMKDTAQLNAFAVYGLEKFLSRTERAEIFRAMPGVSSMLPIGGNAIWGNESWAPDDKPEQVVSYGSFVRYKDTNSTAPKRHNLTVDETFPFLWSETEDWYKDMLQRSYSQGVAHTRHQVEDNQLLPAKWINPLETRLPLAPNLKIYCFYGIGKPTERAYFYKDDNDPLSALNVTLDTSVTEGEIDHGVVMGEGDGTVNILSAGYMCTKGWKLKRYNPAGVKIITHEMAHDPDKYSPRGGPNTADHVDILGRSSLNDLILKVAGGKGDLVNEKIESNILEYGNKIEIYDEE
ncbi:Phospholipid:diacylglycerol acyltransferase [Venturia nashicola]|uniref:Phospholipid:diacylglycerol acyltransferase n=1 Tax=Venturia nashicola TaxID=86259 RepID=A0A4Z1PJK8_9PEZI|nr:Phospholipid:diacylglycerol acyltransferase [Venturia nashicola]TLD35104.1 Phospholipid:diacylglycerol acyltransferase [Venturia nashicola]